MNEEKAAGWARGVALKGGCQMGDWIGLDSRDGEEAPVLWVALVLCWCLECSHSAGRHLTSGDSTRSGSQEGARMPEELRGTSAVALGQQTGFHRRQLSPRWGPAGWLPLAPCPCKC